jgi:hypothetical protein
MQCLTNFDVHNMNEKKYFKKIILHQMRQYNFLGRGDFCGSVGKGKQTKFYFRPNIENFLPSKKPFSSPSACIIHVVFCLSA